MTRLWVVYLAGAANNPGKNHERRHPLKYSKRYAPPGQVVRLIACATQEPLP